MHLLTTVYLYLSLIGLLRYNPDVDEPVMLIQACELSAFGFFQRGKHIYSIYLIYILSPPLTPTPPPPHDL